MQRSTDAKLQNLKASNSRQPRSDKKARVAPYLDDDTNIKLQMLATATGHTKGSLAEFILRYVLNDVMSVTNIQKAHEGAAPKAYEIRALKIGERTTYNLKNEDNEII